MLAERGQLARDVDMDDLDRTMRAMTLDNLPVSPAAAVTELNGYDWASSEAREKYQEIKNLIGRELLDQRFAGMKEELEGATDEDRASVAEMLHDLNVLLGKHRAGMATEQDFQDFMAKHRDQFPENPRNIEELVELLAQRSAAARRLLKSMTPEQRAELMQLAAEAFGSEELMNLVGELDANLRGIRPDLDWTGSESFDGDGASGGMGLGEATRAMRDLGGLDELAATLGGERPGDIDLDEVADLLGADTATSAKHLRDLEKALRDSGLLSKSESGSLQLSPKALRMLGKELLKGATPSYPAASTIPASPVSRANPPATPTLGSSATGVGHHPDHHERAPAQCRQRRAVRDHRERHRSGRNRNAYEKRRCNPCGHLLFHGDGRPLDADEADRASAEPPHHHAVPQRRARANRFRPLRADADDRRTHRPAADAGKRHQPAARAAFR